MRDARPNRGHLSLARLHRAGRLPVVITQNIDGLHQKAGIPPEAVVEIHGSESTIVCVGCGRRFTWEQVLPGFDGECPVCTECGGWLKPATVSFGQPMPAEETRRAFAEAAAADLLIVVGSSLQVYPAASLPGQTRKAGGRVIIVNNEPTCQDDLAELVLQGQAGTILHELAERAIDHQEEAHV